MLAAVGLFGSATAFGESRKFEQAVRLTASPSAAATIRILRIVCSLWLAVEADGDDERSSQRQVEVVRGTDLFIGSGDVRFRIETRVLRPGVQVPTGEA